jgi:hypothetical protein
VSRAPENGVYHQMIQRCYNPKQSSYAYYGARGITVCDEWRESYKTFLADMGPRPGKGYSIDRRDNDGPYCKDNCFWNVHQKQCRNRRSTIYVDLGDERHKLIDLVEQAGLKWHTVYARLFAYGWTVEEALTTPTRNTA